MPTATADKDLSLLRAERKSTLTFAKRRAKQRNDVLQRKTAVSTEELQQICRTLARVAQRYVPTSPAAFADFVEVAQCIKTLKAMGLDPDINERFNAVVGATGNEAILKSATYRYLQNKCIAGFATIADLTEKPASTGSPEFQRGVREGYRRASDIAVMFLDDIQAGAPKC